MNLLCQRPRRCWPSPAHPRASLLSKRRRQSLVAMAHELLLEEQPVLPLREDEKVKNETTGSFWLNLHLSFFLWNVAPQLALTIVRCDRIPALGPWYALILLSVRAYAMAAAASIIRKEDPLTVGGVNNEEQATYWLLRILALPARSTLLRMPSAIETLLSPQTRSSYEPVEGQDGACWVLLRAALSGTEVQKSIAVGNLIFKHHGNNKAMIARFGVLLLLMRTQASVTIMVMEKEDAKSKTCSGIPEQPSGRLSAMFDILKFVTMPASSNGLGGGVADQSVFDMMTTFIAGSSDIEFLSRPSSVFTNLETLGAAWKDELEVVRGEQMSKHAIELPATDGVPCVIPNLHLHFINQFELVANEWIKTDALHARTRRDCDKTLAVINTFDALSEKMETGGFGYVLQHEGNIGEMVDSVLERLYRVAASHARTITTRGSRWHFTHCQRNRTPAIRARRASLRQLHQPESTASTSSAAKSSFEKMDNFAIADAAWLRLYLRRELERVMHWSRHQGMWKRGNHRILVAWFSTNSGPRMFARSITLHTMQMALQGCDDGARGRVADGRWLIANIRTRGEDSVMCAALRFTEELQEMLHDKVADSIKEKLDMLQQAKKTQRGEADPLAEGEAVATQDRMQNITGDLEQEDAKTKEQREKDRQEMQKAIDEGLQSVMENSDNIYENYMPCVLDSHRERRAQGELVHGAGRWRVPRMDAASELAMTLFNRVRADENPVVQSSVNICQNTFKHGCSVALISFPPTREDMQSPYVQQKKQALPTHLADMAMTAERAEAEYVSKPSFIEVSAELKEEAKLHETKDGYDDNNSRASTHPQNNADGEEGVASSTWWM